MTLTKKRKDPPSPESFPHAKKKLRSLNEAVATITDDSKVTKDNAGTTASAHGIFSFPRASSEVMKTRKICDPTTIKWWRVFVSRDLKIDPGPFLVPEDQVSTVPKFSSDNSAGVLLTDAGQGIFSFPRASAKVMKKRKICSNVSASFMGRLVPSGAFKHPKPFSSKNAPFSFGKTSVPDTSPFVIGAVEDTTAATGNPKKFTPSSTPFKAGACCDGALATRTRSRTARRKSKRLRTPVKRFGY